MQCELTKQGPLLNQQGNLTQSGWARQLVLDYKRKNVKALPFMIKEWDYYAVLNDEFGIALTVGDNGYIGALTCTIFDFKEPKAITKSVMVPFPLGSFNLPESSKEGDIKVSKKGMTITFSRRIKERILTIDDDNFSEGKALHGKISLTVEESADTLVIATPFNKSKRFYYNQKTNCQRASGTFTFGKEKYDFGDKVSFGVLDWGRGVWTFDNTWYWASGSGVIDGEIVGFNLGYGFGDTSKATENMVFYKGVGHKLENIVFHIPTDSYLSPWKISSSDQRFEMEFIPVIDRNSKAQVLMLQSDQHQVFGYFTGTIVLDNQEQLYLEKFFGFAEKVKNRW